MNNFAYGSNMDESQFTDRVGKVTPPTIASLPDWQFRINTRRVATIVPNPGSTVHGVIWSLTADQFRKLDVVEGVASGVYHHHDVVVRADSETICAAAYVARDSEPGSPREGYLERILLAARRWQLPAYYVDELCTWTGR
jgi:gamma-glutamylcyclotransferase (GGCT)/AIG2-like uncharacterized protein YtfP